MELLDLLGTVLLTVLTAIASLATYAIRLYWREIVGQVRVWLASRKLGFLDDLAVRAIQFAEQEGLNDELRVTGERKLQMALEYIDFALVQNQIKGIKSQEIRAAIESGIRQGLQNDPLLVVIEE